MFVIKHLHIYISSIIYHSVQNHQELTSIFPTDVFPEISLCGWMIWFISLHGWAGSFAWSCYFLATCIPWVAIKLPGLPVNGFLSNKPESQKDTCGLFLPIPEMTEGPWVSHMTFRASVSLSWWRTTCQRIMWTDVKSCHRSGCLYIGYAYVGCLY